MPDKQLAADNLLATSIAMQDINVPFVLFLGTALGAYRDHDFCPGDIDDIDIALAYEYKTQRGEDIKQAMKDIGFTLEHEWDCEFSFIRQYDGWRSKIDFFFLTRPPGIPDTMAWHFYSVPVQVRLIDDRFFKELDEVEFYGHKYKVPGPIEEYLEANYGKDWRTPISREFWNWETDNKCNVIRES